jgi:hypothetical protein
MLYIYTFCFVSLGLPSGDAQCLTVLKTPENSTAGPKQKLAKPPVDLAAIRSSTASVGGRGLRRMMELGTLVGEGVRNIRIISVINTPANLVITHLAALISPFPL